MMPFVKRFFEDFYENDLPRGELFEKSSPLGLSPQKL
jgi:hypothetical protein